MQELFARLINALQSSGPNSADVHQVLLQINTQFPAQADVAKSIVSGWVASPPASAQSVSQKPGAGSSSWKYIASVLAALGIGGAGGAGIDTKALWDSVQTLPLPRIGNRWELLGVVAVVGAVVGFGYSFYRNNWTINLPSFSKSQEQFKVASWGVLRNVFMAALVSAATTWLAFASTAAAPPKDGNLLTWTVLASAMAAGLVGSRMSSGEVEKKVLWEALATSADNPSVAGLGTLVENAKTALDAASIATGKAVPGVTPPKEIIAVRQSAEIEANLLTLFDRPTFRDLLLKLGKPLNSGAAGLTIEPLDQFQSMKPGLKNPLKNLEVPNVAIMTPEQFLAEVDRQGIDATRFKDLLIRVHSQAVRAKEILGTLPPDWTLGADNI